MPPRPSKKQKLTDTSSWPEYFVNLEAVFRALNTSSTFLASRRHVPPRFDTVRQLAAGADTGGGDGTKNDKANPFSVQHAAAIKFLLGPAVIRFEYVPDHELAVYEEKLLSTSSQSRFANDNGNDIFSLPSTTNSSSLSLSNQVLIFEFIDENLKKDQPLSPGGGNGGLTRSDKIRMPSFSAANMTKLVTKRNDKFRDAVCQFLASCTSNKLDAQVVINSELARFLPVLPSLPNPVDEATKPSFGLQGVNSPQRKPISAIVHDLMTDATYAGQVVDGGRKVFAAKPARYGELEFALTQELVDALFTAADVTGFYTHQSQALNSLHNGRNVIVSTSTSSGKSLIYQVPVLRALQAVHTHDPPAVTAIYIFPTKALAQDQKRALQNIIGLMPCLADVVVDTFDGDTPKEDRQHIRDHASIIFTNPDMLHMTILPGIDSWRSFFRNLKFVIVDELHVYAGLFGSHVSMVMRRLRRLCALLGNTTVQFVSCSATIASPGSHMQRMFGVDNVDVIDDDGSPAGEKHFLVWNSPRTRPKSAVSASSSVLSTRRSAMAEGADLFVKLVLNGVRTIAFCRVRTMCELMMKAVRTQLAAIGRGDDLADRVMSYRGGYTAQDRRRIEKAMFDGDLIGIVSTNALELGVDIGSLDAVVIVGFPFSVANLRQQSGRAGRRNQGSLTVLVGDSHPVDQYFMTHPAEIFSRPHDELVLDLDNQLVLEAHLQCAGFEHPVNIRTDESYFGPRTADLARSRMLCADESHDDDDEALYVTHGRFEPWPAKHVSIRPSADDDSNSRYAIVDVTNGRNIVVEEVEPSRVSFTLYEGAVFVHQGRPFLVRELDSNNRIAKIERTTVDWTTTQRDYTDVDAIEIEAMKKICLTNESHGEESSSSYAYFGNIKVTTVVFGYFKLDSRGRMLDAVDVTTTPAVILQSKGFWVDVPDRAIEIISRKRLHLAAAIHAAEHLILSMARGVVMTGASDVRTECKAAEKEFAGRQSQRKRPARLIFYDNGGGGVGEEWFGSGMSRKMFEFFTEVATMAIDRINSCTCGNDPDDDNLDNNHNPGNDNNKGRRYGNGCVECVLASDNCSESAIVVSKPGAAVILNCILGRPVHEDDVPFGPEPNLVVAAAEISPSSSSSRSINQSSIVKAGSVMLADNVEVIE
ncbi:hypothetical protein V1514DRAFT_332051 [Lipomyces japonicus]|uniref:uncharacterized protein n=1 Tax=Lipomyces japonicus TaxID=56871 RepID=UPI0034CECE82